MSILTHAFMARLHDCPLLACLATDTLVFVCHSFISHSPPDQNQSLFNIAAAGEAAVSSPFRFLCNFWSPKNQFNLINLIKDSTREGLSLFCHAQGIALYLLIFLKSLIKNPIKQIGYSMSLSLILVQIIFVGLWKRKTSKTKLTDFIQPCSREAHSCKNVFCLVVERLTLCGYALPTVIGQILKDSSYCLIVFVGYKRRHKEHKSVEREKWKYPLLYLSWPLSLPVLILLINKFPLLSTPPRRHHH